MFTIIRTFCFYLTIFFIGTFSALASTASTNEQENVIESVEYKLPAQVYPDILSDRKTEIWARIFYSKQTLTGQHTNPMVIMLHGNHATCISKFGDTSSEYTDTGKCQPGSKPILNHEGYAYLAKDLASKGFIVISINANRGITGGHAADKNDWGLNLARGRLVLKHLALLNQWSTQPNIQPPITLSQSLLTSLDFSNVGLFGHSRGGEGVRAAYNLYLDENSKWPAEIPNLTIKAIFEIGAVDGQTSRILNADGTVWNQLLPLCDGDVYDLEGRYPFERMLLNTKEQLNAQKSVIEVWGANHNFFNTAWTRSDARGCEVGKPIFNPRGKSSKRQRIIAQQFVSAFFSSHLGQHPSKELNRLFNPLEALPKELNDITQIDRDFTPSPSSQQTLTINDVFEYKNLGYFNSSSEGIDFYGTDYYTNNETESPFGAEIISWQPPFISHPVLNIPLNGKVLDSYKTLDFRVARNLAFDYDIYNYINDPLNTEPSTDFTIQLETTQNEHSIAVPVSDYTILNGPVMNPIFRTVRIPLNDFGPIDLSKIKNIQLVFNKTPTGAIAITNIRANRELGLGTETIPEKHTLPPSNIHQYHQRHLLTSPTTTPRTLIAAQRNHYQIIKHQHPTFKTGGTSRPIEIQLTSDQPFEITDRLPLLKIGDKIFKFMRYTSRKDMKKVSFYLSQKEYQTLTQDSVIELVHDKIWQFGRYNH